MILGIRPFVLNGRREWYLRQIQRLVCLPLALPDTPNNLSIALKISSSPLKLFLAHFGIQIPYGNDIHLFHCSITIATYLNLPRRENERKYRHHGGTTRWDASLPHTSLACAIWPMLWLRSIGPGRRCVRTALRRSAHRVKREQRPMATGAPDRLHSGICSCATAGTEIGQQHTPGTNR